MAETSSLSMNIFQKRQKKKMVTPQFCHPTPPSPHSCRNTNISPLSALTKRTLRAFSSFPIDLCLSLGIFPNQAMAKTSLFNKLQCFYYLLKYLGSIKKGFLIDWIYIKANNFKTAAGRIKKYLLGIA